MVGLAGDHPDRRDQLVAIEEIQTKGGDVELDTHGSLFAIKPFDPVEIQADLLYRLRDRHVECCPRLRPDDTTPLETVAQLKAFDRLDEARIVCRGVHRFTAPLKISGHRQMFSDQGNDFGVASTGLEGTKAGQRRPAALFGYANILDQFFSQWGIPEALRIGILECPGKIPVIQCIIQDRSRGGFGAIGDPSHFDFVRFGQGFEFAGKRFPTDTAVNAVPGIVAIEFTHGQLKSNLVCPCPPFSADQFFDLLAYGLVLHIDSQRFGDGSIRTNQTQQAVAKWAQSLGFDPQGCIKQFFVKGIKLGYLAVGYPLLYLG